MNYELLGEFEKAQKEEIQILTLHEDNESLLESDPFSYLTILKRLCNRYQSSYHFKEWLECIKKINHIPPSNDFSPVQKKMIITTELIKYYNLYYNIPKLTHYTNQLADTLDNNRNIMPISINITSYYMLLAMGIITNNKKAIQLGIDFFAKLSTQYLLTQHYYRPYLCINQLVLFEEKEYNLLLTKNKTIIAIYKKLGRDYSVEIAVLKALAQLCKTKDPEKIACIVEKTIATFFELVSDPTKKTGLLYFDYTCWLNALKNRRKMSEEFEANHSYYDYPNPHQKPLPEEVDDAEFE